MALAQIVSKMLQVLERALKEAPGRHGGVDVSAGRSDHLFG